MYYHHHSIAFLNGEWINASTANAGLFNQTMHYGSGAFEGIRSYSTPDGVRVFKAKEHYERLLFSANKMHLTLNYTVDQLTELTYHLLDKNQLQDAYIRPLVFLGENMNLAKTEDVNLFLCAWKWEKYLGHKLLNVMTSSYERPNPKSVPVDAKITGHYTNSILASTEAKSKGFDEALLTDMNGNVAEGPGANFFYEKDGTLFTCPTGNILPGITRKTVFEMAKEMHVSVEEKWFTPKEVFQADGAFFTGTAIEITGIKALDNNGFNLEWEDTIGYQLAKLYKRKVAKNEFAQFDLV
jgi:branched-chain amino acid aminotransferase